MTTQREMYHGNVLYAWRESAANRTRAIDVDKWAQNQADILHLPGAQGEKKLSILDNAISPSSAFVRVDTEGGAPADDLAAITPGDLHVGMLLHLVAADSERVVTLRNSADATGIQTVDGKDVALDTQYGIVLRLVSTEALTYWEEIPGPLRAKKQPVTSKDNLGVMQVGDNLDVTAQGVVDVPVASESMQGIGRSATTAEVESGITGENGPAWVTPEQLRFISAWRKSWIGVPRPWRSTTLPANHCWANGDLVPFSDWPELKEVYDNGGFEGMLLPYDADAATQAANLGKWRPNAVNPTGLFTPNYVGIFLRGWEPGAGKEAGAWGRDEIRDIVGSVRFKGYTASGTGFMGVGIDASGALYTDDISTYAGSLGTHTVAASTLKLSASKSVPTGSKNVPEHIWQPIIIGLGHPA